MIREIPLSAVSLFYYCLCYFFVMDTEYLCCWSIYYRTEIFIASSISCEFDHHHVSILRTTIFRVTLHLFFCYYMLPLRIRAVMRPKHICIYYTNTKWNENTKHYLGRRYCKSPMKPGLYTVCQKPIARSGTFSIKYLGDFVWYALTMLSIDNMGGRGRSYNYAARSA